MPSFGKMAGLYPMLVMVVMVAVFPGNLFAAGAKSAARKPVRLFGSVEVRSPLKAFSGWQRVLKKGKLQVREYAQCGRKKTPCPSGAKAFNSIIGQVGGKARLKQLRMVNRFFNKWPYRLDRDAYGLSDYWATPGEFLRKSGDCEDYAITKFFALRRLGFSTDKMRIVVLKDYIRNMGHAVLAVYMGNDIYILDNMSDLVLSHQKFKHYIPFYSMNETNMWAHIKTVKRAVLPEGV